MRFGDIMILRSIFAKRKNEVLGVRLSLKLLKFKKATEAEAELYAERYKRILFACAQTDESGAFARSGEGGILLNPSRAEEYRSQMQELDDAESDVVFSISEAEAEELKLTLEEFESILEFIQEGGDGND